MKIYWSLKQVPELSAQPWRNRNIVFKVCCSRHMLHAEPNRWSILAYLAVLALPSAGMALASYLLPRSEFSGLLVALAGCAGFLAGLFLHFQIAVNYLRPFLRNYVQTVEPNGVAQLEAKTARDAWRTQARADLRRPRTWLIFAGLYVATYVLVAGLMFILNLVVPHLPWISKPYVNPDPPPLITAFYCANLVPVLLVLGWIALYFGGEPKRLRKN